MRSLWVERSLKQDKAATMQVQNRKNEALTRSSWICICCVCFAGDLEADLKVGALA
jgi:hypothetical protein